MTFLEDLEQRRSIYALGRDEVDVNQAVEVIEEAVRQSPSAFNSQTSRVVILANDQHIKLWDLIIDDMMKLMVEQGAPEVAQEATKNKLKSFQAGIGTALFYEDQDVVKKLQEDFPLYADNFPVWSEQGSGIATANAWTALSTISIGANLQHYNPVIDASIAKTWDIPASWKLRSQLVFGSIEAPAGVKEFMPDDQRFKVFK